MFVASDDATAGSVIAKHERISPASSGLSQRSFCSRVPKRARTSILPVSGAEQLKTSGPISLRPIISQSGAYSRFVSPAPCSLSGKNRFHRPAARAFGLRSSMISVGDQGFRSISEIIEDLKQIGRAQSELQSPDHLVCRLLLEKKKKPKGDGKDPLTIPIVTQPIVPVRGGIAIFYHGHV